MALSFSFGMKQFWNESAEMQASGLYWVNTDSQDAAYGLGGQVLAAQTEEIITTFILPKENPITGGTDEPLGRDNILISRLLNNCA